MMQGGQGRGDAIALCALVPYPPDTAPSQRFRIEQWSPLLAQDGIAVELVPFASPSLMRLLYAPGRPWAKTALTLSAVARRLLQVPRVRRFDVVLVHRALCLAGPAVPERLLSLCGRPVIYDFDDAIFLLDTTNANRAFGWLKFPGKTAAICRLSDHVVVGNEHLAGYARRFNPRVTVVPTSVDTESYRPTPRPAPSARVVVGWTGSSTSQAHLEGFAPVLRELARRRSVEVRVISDRKPDLPGLDATWRPWSAVVSADVAELSQFDIGIMPVPDDAWSRGKCATKALLYMAMGTPTVCSPVGANQALVRHDRNGLLASTPEEWLACLERLIDDASLRDRLGRAGRLTVEGGYSARRSAEAFGRVVREVLER